MDLSSNEIEVIGGEIGVLKNLRVVRLSFNRIGSLPAQFSALIQLEELYLDHNRFDSLPACLSSLPLLKVHFRSLHYVIIALQQYYVKLCY